MNRFQFATVALIALSLVSSISAQGDSSHGLYAEALARERVLRDPRRLPSLSELRSAVELYESFVPDYKPATRTVRFGRRPASPLKLTTDSDKPRT